MNDITKTENKVSNLAEKLFNISLLNESDIGKLNKSCDFILSTYTTVPMFRPLSIKLFGVLNDKEFPTVDMKYIQCKTEAEVHANELIRELHEYQIQLVAIEKAEYLLSKVMKEDLDKAKIEQKEHKVAEISFDMKEQSLIISRKKFELKQLEKKIKYRIMEVNEWREISDELSKSENFKNKSYNQVMMDAFTNNYKNKLNDPAYDSEKKQAIKEQLDLLNQFKTQLS